MLPLLLALLFLDPGRPPKIPGPWVTLQPVAVAGEADTDSLPYPAAGPDPIVVSRQVLAELRPVCFQRDTGTRFEIRAEQVAAVDAWRAAHPGRALAIVSGNFVITAANLEAPLDGDPFVVIVAGPQFDNFMRGLIDLDTCA